MLTYITVCGVKREVFAKQLSYSLSLKQASTERAMSARIELFIKLNFQFVIQQTYLMKPRQNWFV